MLWNSLPTEIKASKSKVIFKRKLASRQTNFWLDLIFSTYRFLKCLLLEYLLLVDWYGFHEKELFILWNYHITIKVNHWINSRIDVMLSKGIIPTIPFAICQANLNSCWVEKLSSSSFGSSSRSEGMAEACCWFSTDGIFDLFNGSPLDSFNPSS